MKIIIMMFDPVQLHLRPPVPYLSDHKISVDYTAELRQKVVFFLHSDTEGSCGIIESLGGTAHCFTSFSLVRFNHFHRIGDFQCAEIDARERNLDLFRHRVRLCLCSVQNWRRCRRKAVF